MFNALYILGHDFFFFFFFWFVFGYGAGFHDFSTVFSWTGIIEFIMIIMNTRFLCTFISYLYACLTQSEPYATFLFK